MYQKVSYHMSNVVRRLRAARNLRVARNQCAKNHVFPSPGIVFVMGIFHCRGWNGEKAETTKGLV